jgi:hypothetical protein
LQNEFEFQFQSRHFKTDFCSVPLPVVNILTVLLLQYRYPVDEDYRSEQNRCPKHKKNENIQHTRKLKKREMLGIESLFMIMSIAAEQGNFKPKCY